MTRRGVVRWLAVVSTAAATAAGAGAAETKPACAQAKLPGLWTSEAYSLRIARDLRYEAAGAPNVMTIDVRGRLAVDGCTVRFTDAAGDLACPAAQVGTYTFEVTDTTLRFAVVADPCEGRRAAVTGAALRRTAEQR